ncbi:unnamed protein product [Arabis nemorensis]|uniref:Trafficking protein particle complex subunit 2-like protein n=1 Tax=Arabis nemorensis TaxID=586526 RepID=A0A565C4M9_9BRAS|nr:unnamed protein product [Arabis nemorensis]
MIVCVSVVGHQNNPLYIQSFTDADDALKLHHIVHCSLDVIEERVNNPKKSGTTLNEAFLGLLYPTVNYKVYGYLTNTKVKFILVTTDLDVRDTDVRSFFRKFHAAYVDAVSNPFHVPGKKITSRTFARTRLLGGLVQANNLLEDQSQLESGNLSTHDSGSYGTFFGLYGGHGGSSISRVISKMKPLITVHRCIICASDGSWEHLSNKRNR